ncbi:MAG: hypothetical protein AAB215_09515, partial [Planctomycetota bacterium]
LDVPTLPDFMFIHDLRRLWTVAGLDGEVRKKTAFGERLDSLRCYIEDPQRGDVRYRNPAQVTEDEVRRLSDWAFRSDLGAVPFIRNAIP